ncbi:MAG: hypothetical protein AB7O45_02390 [Alphaproteobacteria bacterium]
MTTGTLGSAELGAGALGEAGSSDIGPASNIVTGQAAVVGAGITSSTGSGALAAQSAGVSAGQTPPPVPGELTAQRATIVGSGTVASTGSGELVAGAAGVSDVPAPVLGSERLYLLEITGYDPALPGERVLRYSSRRTYTSHATDDPPLANYLSRVQSIGTFEMTMFAPGKTSGVAEVNYGVVKLINVDGALDPLIDWGFDGRAFVIRVLPNEDAALAEARLVYSGTIESVDFDEVAVTFHQHDRMELLRNPVQETLYAGTTVSGLAADAEGTANLQGEPKPLVWGPVLNVTPAEADPFNLVFQINDGALRTIDAVYDRGIPLTSAAANYTSLADLKAATVAPGKYATALALGLIKPGSPPVGALTADATEGDNASVRTAAQIARRILLDCTGLTEDDLVNGTFATLDALNSAEVGIFVNGGEAVIDVVSTVLQSIGAQIVADRQGKFRVHRLDLPGSETPVASLDETDVVDEDGIAFLRMTDNDVGVPAWQYTLDYRRNWTRQTKDEVSARVPDDDCLSQDRLAFLARPWRSVFAEDPAVRVKHTRSPTSTRQSLILDPVAAQAEVDRIKPVYAAEPRYLVVPVPAERVDHVEVMDVISFAYPRFGLDGGRRFRVLGLRNDFDRDIVWLYLFGGVA